MDCDEKADDRLAIRLVSSEQVLVKESNLKLWPGGVGTHPASASEYARVL